MNRRKNFREATYCDKTGKVSFSSEAKATRKLTKYDEIQRVYFCKDCEGFHLTSETVEETLSNGGVNIEEENRLLRKYNDKLVHKVGRLRKTIGILKGEIKVTDELLQDRQKILDAIPECESHGSCIPHALDWINQQIKK